MGYLRRSKIRPFILLLAFTAVIIYSYVFDPGKKPGKQRDCIVEKVKDGDTVTVRSLPGDEQYTCRLYGIDAPELEHPDRKGQPYGVEAKHELEKLVYKEQVRVIFTGDKSYNREICFVEQEGKSMNLEMVRKGYAWAYRKHLDRPYASEYIDAEKRARDMGIGLWQQKNPQPPWEFRNTPALK